MGTQNKPLNGTAYRRPLVVTFDGKRMKVADPKRWWFPAALAGALLVQFIAIFAMIVIRALADGDEFPLRGIPMLVYWFSVKWKKRVGRLENNRGGVVG